MTWSATLGLTRQASVLACWKARPVHIPRQSPVQHRACHWSSWAVRSSVAERPVVFEDLSAEQEVALEEHTPSETLE